MAQNNPDLVIRLRANSDDLTRGFRSAEAAAKVMERELARLEAQQRAMAATEAAAYREEAARNAAKEQAIRRMAALEAQAYREEAQRVAARRRQIEEIQKAEADAYREQARRDATATEQRQRNIEEIRRAEDAAYREQARRDSAAAATRQRNLDEVRRAEDAAYREQARRNQRAADERQRQLDEVARAERAAYAEQARRDAAAARAAERAAEAERRRIERRRQAMGELGAAGVAMGAALAAGLALSVRAAVEWESAWTGVTKTVNGSAEEMDLLEGQLRGLARSLPVSTTEIAGVAEAAGQLGIKRQDVAKFTQVMIGLGKATNLSSDEAATQLARLMNIMQTSPDDVDRLGATIVGLGNNFATTEAEISAMALRIAGAGKTIGLTESDVYGVAAALSSVGIEAEAGGSAISTVFINLAKAANEGGEAVEGFANVAGMTSDQFSQLFRDDPAQALLAFEEGLGRVTKAGGDTFGILEDLGITEIRQRDSVLRLANAGDLLHDALQTANQDWRENSALVNEVNKRYGTSASRFQIAKNGLNDMAINLGNELLPALTRAGDDVGQLAHEFAALPRPVQEGAAVLGTLGAAIGIIGGGAMVAAPRLAALGASLTEMGARGAKVATGLGRVAGVLSGPWGIAIAAATVAVGYFLEQHLQAEKVVDDLTEAIKLDSGALGENARNAIAAKLAQDGLIDSARNLGIPLNLLTENALGNVEAQKQLYVTLRAVNGVLDSHNRIIAGAKLDPAVSGNKALAAAYNEGGDALVAYRDDLLKVIDGTDDMRVSVQGAQGKAKDFAEATAEMGGAAGEAGEAAEGAAGGVSQLGSVAERAQDPLQGMADSLGMAVEDLKKMVDATAETSASFVDFSAAWDTAVDRKTKKEEASRKSSEDSAKGTSDAYSESTKSVKASFEEFFKVLEEQAKAQESWQRNLSQLASRVPADFLAYLAELGPGSATLIDEMNKQSSQKLDETVALWQQSGKGAGAAFAEGLYGAGPVLNGIARVAGQDVANTYAEQLRKGEIDVKTITARWGAAIEANVPDDVSTTFHAVGVDGAIHRVGDLQTAIRDLPNSKTIRVNVFDAQGNSRSSTVTRNPDGTVTTKTDLGRSTKFAVGGPVHGAGTATSDSIPAYLSDGEYVIKAAAVDHYGQGFFDQVNTMRFATGGRVRADGTAPTTNVDVSLPDPVQVTSSVNSDLDAIADSVQAAAAAAAALAGSDSSETPGQGTLAAGGQGMGWQWQIATLRKAFPGLALNSGFRPGSKTVSGNTSYHARGRAVDVPPRMDVFNWLLANYGNSPEIIFSPANGRQIKNGRPHMYSGAVRAMHFNHVHWAYDQGGVARGMGMMPKLTSAPERVLSPGQTRSFDRLVDLLGSRFADGGPVTRGTRGTMITGQDPATGALSFGNGFDVDAYLRLAMKPVSLTIDDSALRAANFQVAQWTTALAMANEELAKATTKAEYWADQVKDAEDQIADAQRDQESAAKDLATAQERLGKARASKDAGDIADANKDITDALNAQKTASAIVRDQTERLTRARAAADTANRELYDSTRDQASAEGMLTDAQQKATDAQEALNQAKADALAYAQKIAEAARSGSEVTGLFSADDAARALKYAQAAYEASRAEAQAATDATEYQGKIDQLAAAGAKLAAAQAAMGASYGVQKATIQGTRDEVEKLALSYGFTAQQARDLAESAVPLANTGETLVDSLTRQLKAVQEFSRSIDTLRALGLSQALIGQVLEAGPDKGMQVAQELIGGGKDMVKRLNDLQAQLVAASDSLGRSAANAAYGTGTPTVSVAPAIERGLRITRAGGGPVSGPGTATSDSVPAYLSNGEYVIKAAAVERYGEHFFEGLNAMRFASGGAVATAGPAFGAPVTPTVVVQTTEHSGMQVHGPLLAVDTIRENVDMDLLWRQAPVGVGALGRGGGR